MEIRGAGELLGDDQSGQISSIGFTLYMEMLEQAVEALKEGREPSLDAVTAKQTEIELRLPALFPDDYIFDVNTRLSLYKKLASCKTNRAINELQIELIDRFGLLPDAAKNLIKIAQMKLQAQIVGIKKVEGNAVGGVIEFSQETQINPSFIIQLLQSQPKIYRMDGPQKLKFNVPTQSAKDRLQLVADMLEQFSQQLRAA
jgi:transcription-repair coupling factor (superfamily II helicase)